MTLPTGYFDDEEGLVGKTITKVTSTSDSITLVFSDGSYTQLYASTGCDCCDPTIEFGRPTDYELLMAGLISRGEYNAILEKSRLAKEEQDFMLYERLRVKFEAARNNKT